MTPEPPQSDTGLRCPKCGYNLTAITSRTCPECGEACVVTNAQGYLAKHPPSGARKICTATWGVGTILIVLSWFRVVPSLVGWIGFGFAGVAWLVSSTLRR